MASKRSGCAITPIRPPSAASAARKPCKVGGTAPWTCGFFSTRLGIERAVPALCGTLDVGAIGVGGHYIGAHSAGLLAGMKVFGPNGEAETFDGPRIKAVLMLCPTGRGQGLTQDSWKEMDLPMLMMTGPDDVSRRTGNDAAWRTEPFRVAAPGEKFLVSVKGLDGTYGGLVGKQASLGEIGRYAQSGALAFRDASLKGDPEAKAWLESDALASSSKGIVKVERW